MNGTLKRIIALAMTFVILTITPLCDAAPKSVEAGSPTVARAAEDESGGKYIKDVLVGMGDTEEEAKKELEEKGYTILKDDDGNYADLNKGAGSKSSLKTGENDKIVYLGYKTTSDATDAVTDMAVMNMDGGYSIEDYNALLDQQMDTNIKPFMNSFVSTLKEYRENYKKLAKSDGHIRADYIRKMLNKFTDDDTGKPMGDLLLNKTLFEMSDSEIKSLSDAEKKEHADILTILMQANGRATLAIEMLLTRATDPGDDTWIDRMSETSLEDLKDRIKEEEPQLKSNSDVNEALDKKYQDTAKVLLGKWKKFQKDLSGYEDAAEDLTDNMEDTNEKMDKAEGVDFENTSDEDKELSDTDIENTNEAVEAGSDQIQNLENVAIGAYLETVEYGDGTLYDFFCRDYGEVSGDENIRNLYPMVDSLTEGQKAGLDFVALDDLVSIAVSDENSYKEMEKSLSKAETASVYEGVNRELYEKGGVGLTNDAMRKQKATSDDSEDYTVSTTAIVLYCVTGVLALSAATSLIVHNVMTKRLPEIARMGCIPDCWNNFEKMFAIRNQVSNHITTVRGRLRRLSENPFKNMAKNRFYTRKWKADLVKSQKAERVLMIREDALNPYNPVETNKVHFVGNFYKWLKVGLTVLAAIMVVVDIAYTIYEMREYYNVEFAMIPGYMVDEEDIVTTNEDGEKVLDKDQTVYYRAVRCNRTYPKLGSNESGEYYNRRVNNYKAMQDKADLNGDIGKQWLALYTAKSDHKTPILADSLLYTINTDKLPTGYTTGIHDFDGDSPCNLNKKAYLYPSDPPVIKVFYKHEQISQISETGSIFSAASFALGGGGGVVIGFLLAALMIGRRKRSLTE